MSRDERARASPSIVKAAVSPLQAQATAPPGARIVRAAIFPAIGFSRVGNSDAGFLALEVLGLLDEPDRGFKDAVIPRPS